MNSELSTGGGSSAASLQIEIDGNLRHLELAREANSDRWSAMLDGEAVEVDARLIRPGVLSLVIAGRSFRCILDEGPVETAIQIAGGRYLFSVEDPRSLAASRRKSGAHSGQQIIKAPMPGRIVRVLAAAGEAVAAHQGVLVIEAMKMQNELKAARAGRVAEVKVAAGMTVAAGEALVVIE